jgi:2-dehydropantoate 2-reductase
MVDSKKLGSETPPLRICVVGAGAVGGFLACMLARAGHQVSVIARGSHLAAIQQNGLSLTSTGGLEAFTVQVRATDDLSRIGPQDVVFLSLKAHDVPGIARHLRTAIESHTVVVPTLNGIPWWYFHGLPSSALHAPIACLDPSGEAARHIDMQSVIGCVVRIAATVSRPGVVQHTFGNRFIFGEPSGALSERLQKLCGVLRDAGVDAQASSEIRNEIWTKLAGNLSTNPVSALTHGSLGDLYASPTLVPLIRQLFAECRDVGAAYGIQLTSDIEGNLDRTRNLGDSKPSMLQDVEKGRPMEIPAILESAAELARRADVRTPALDVILSLISERAKHPGQWEQPQ